MSVKAPANAAMIAVTKLRFNMVTSQSGLLRSKLNAHLLITVHFLRFAEKHVLRFAEKHVFFHFYREDFRCSTSRDAADHGAESYLSTRTDEYLHVLCRPSESR